MGISSLYVRGPYRGPSGYEHHVREFARELHRAGIALQLEHVDAWSPVQPRAGFLDPWYESLSSPVDSPLALQFCMPNQIVRHTELIDVNFTMFESSRTPKYWIELARLIDWTVVPTEFSRQAWLDSGAPEERLRVCPLGVRGELFSGAHEPWPVTLLNGRSFDGYRHRFLNISAWDGRKNLEGLITTWLKATHATDDAALMLKITIGDEERAAKMPGLLASCERWSGRSLHDAAPIAFVFDILGAQEMPRLYAAGTHYLSMSHGEGWDLPMMEAIASGLIPIAPDHSAYRTYLDPTVALLIPSREVDVPVPYNFGWFRDLSWWNPDERTAIELIRAIIDDDLSPVASARDRVIGEYTWERATGRLIEILNEAASVSPIPAGR